MNELTRFLAVLMLAVLSTANVFAAYWFVYGLWPLHYWPLVVFGVAGSALSQTSLSIVTGRRS